MDGTRFTGDQQVWRVMGTWGGGDGWSSDRDLTGARVVIGRPGYRLSALLRADERFERVYEDAVAVVFVARDATNGVKRGANSFEQLTRTTRMMSSSGH